MGRFSQPQVTHNDDYHLTTAKRDTINGVAGIDASKEVINDVPVSKLVDMGEQSFDNLLDNGDFKLWSAGGSSADPDEWSHAYSPTVNKESTIIKKGVYSVELTHTSIAALYQSIARHAEYQNRRITLYAWTWCAAADTAKIRINDGVSTTSSTYHTGGSGWELLKVTRTLDAAASAFKAELIIDISGTAYFSGVIMVEGPVSPAFSPKPVTEPATYGEMYIYNNSTATVIETADTPIALRQISEGLQKGFIFDAGSTGAITEYVDYSGTVADTVAFTTATPHGLSTGDVITIRGTTNYNGIHTVTVVYANYLYISAAWAGDDGASDWDQGASLTAQAGSDGVYTSTWQMTTAPAGACELCFKVNINDTPQDKSTACRDMAVNDKDNNSSTCLLTVAEDDIIWLSVQSDSTDNITNSMGNMNLERM